MCVGRQVLGVVVHAAIRTLVERALALEGYVVRTAAHGQAAWG
jgi:CheY-like chemotaxis protein